MSAVRKKILLVDDDTELLRLISIRLGAAGYDVTAHDGAAKALTSLAQNRPHLVVTDLRMDGMDGMTLFQHIHRSNPALPVIILTAHATVPDAISAISSGVFGYLTKPFDSKALLAQVEKALQVTGQSGETFNDESAEAWSSEIITRSPRMQDLLSQARLMSESDANVLIQGESGTGKELLARAIHRASARRDKPFVAVNCGAIPETLLESELFGHVKGSFTGAMRDHQGLFQAADGGTLFLDEIGDMPLSLQVKLLRVLQEREVRPVGATQNIPIDVRVTSATHRNLEEALSAGTFREDLYYRLNVVSLDLPPLRERREDIPLLASHFLEVLNKRYRKSVNGFSPEAMEVMVSAQWPGNVRQLFNLIEQTLALSTTAIVPAALVQKCLQSELSGIPSFEEARKRFERDYLVQLLKITNGNVSQAARLAKRNRTEFYKLLQRNDLTPGSFKAMAI
jgi:two-component system, NtrC family, response regulator GlrR